MYSERRRERERERRENMKGCKTLVHMITEAENSKICSWQAGHPGEPMI